MEVKINTWADLKEFIGTLTEEQLQYAVKLSECDRPLKTLDCVEVLECDYINPSGEVAEPIVDYLPGGAHYEENEDERVDVDSEPIVATAGFLFFSTDY